MKVIEAAAYLSPAERARLNQNLERLIVVHALTPERIAALLDEPGSVIGHILAGAVKPSRELAQKVEHLMLNMSHNSLHAWKQRVGASAGYELLIDRSLTILAVNGSISGVRQRGTQGYLDPALFIGRNYNSILPSLDCALIETHGNGIEDLIKLGFFDGKIRCVRFCAEINIGKVARVGVREFWPVETADAGIVAHAVLHDSNDMPRALSAPGILVHWREIVPELAV